MGKQQITGRRPGIIVSETDYDRLSILADNARARTPEVADGLQAELDRARIVAEAAMPEGVVRMGSTVLFAMDGAATREVTLVFPKEADIARGRLSIMTPVGAALIGLSAGQRIAWTAADGRAHDLVVHAVRQPPAAAG